MTDALSTPDTSRESVELVGDAAEAAAKPVKKSKKRAKPRVDKPGAKKPGGGGGGGGI